MATFADKYRKGDGGGTTSFASLYRKDASGNAPLGSARDEQMRLTKRSEEVRKKVAAAQAEAEKFAQKANRYGTAVNVLESIGKSFVRPAISLYQGVTQPMRSAFGLSPAAGTYNVPVLGPTETYQNQANRVVSDIRSQGGSLGRAAVATAGIAAQPAIDVLSTVYTPAKIALGFRGGKIIGAGIQGAKIGAPISGAQSLADSAVEGKDAKQAAIDAAKATLFGAGAGFGLGVFGGAVGEGASSFARFYRKGATETAEQVAKKVETKPVEKPPVKTSEKSEPKVSEVSKVSDTYDAALVSKKASNSFLSEPTAPKKPGRLDGDAVSVKEAVTGNAESGKYIKDRIVLGKNDEGKVVLEDGSHLLEAYRQKGIPIPKDKILLKDGVTLDDALSISQERVEIPKDKSIPPTAKPSGFAEKSESQVLKKLNSMVDEAEKIDTDLPTTTFRREFEVAEEKIKADPKKAYNDAVYGEKGESAQTRSALQLTLLENAKQKGDNNAMAEIGMAAAKHARKSGQEVVMFRALYDQDATNKLLVNLAQTKLKNIETRYPKILRRIFKEGGDDAVTAATKVIKKKAPDIKEAQSIIDAFICK